MCYRHTILLLFPIVLLLYADMAKAATDTFLIHTDYPFVNDDEKMLLNIYYSSDSIFTGSFSIQFYRYESNDDSLCVLRRKYPKTVFKRGLNKMRADFSSEDSNTWYAPKLYGILKRTDGLPPGSYKVFMT